MSPCYYLDTFESKIECLWAPTITPGMTTTFAIQFRNSVSSSGTGVLRLFHRIYRSP